MKKNTTVTEPTAPETPIAPTVEPIPPAEPTQEPGTQITTPTGYVRPKHIKMVSVTYERKFNLDKIKKFESVVIGVTQWADVDPDEEDPDAVILALFTTAKAQIKEQVMPLLNPPKEKKTESTDPQYVPVPPAP